MCSISEPRGRCKAALAILEACWAGKLQDMVPANGAGSYSTAQYGHEPLMCTVGTWTVVSPNPSFVRLFSPSSDREREGRAVDCYLVVGMDGEHSQRPVGDIVPVYAASTDQRQKWPQQGRQFPIPAAHMDVSIIDLFGGVMTMSQFVWVQCCGSRYEIVIRQGLRAKYEYAYLLYSRYNERASVLPASCEILVELTNAWT